LGIRFKRLKLLCWVVGTGAINSLEVSIGVNLMSAGLRPVKAEAVCARAVVLRPKASMQAPIHQTLRTIHLPCAWVSDIASALRT